MPTKDTEATMAVFLDLENIALGARDAKYPSFDIEKVLERLLLKGHIVVKKAYCDFDRYKDFKRGLHEAAFELIEIPHVRQSGKNSADIRMVVDALDLCYTKGHVDTFVILSGDSDFSPLVSKLRENAKTVIGVGVKNSTSDLFINNCDEFIYYDDLVRKDPSRARRRSAAARPTAAAAADGPTPAADSKRPELTEALDLIVETLEALSEERGGGEQIWGSMIKQAIKRRHPGFNERFYGFKSFNDLLADAEKRGFLSLRPDEKSGGYTVRVGQVRPLKHRLPPAFKFAGGQMSADEDVLIILPVRGAVLFPGVVLPVAISNKLAIAAAQEAVRTQRRVGLLLQSDLAAEEVSAEGLHRVGTIASIVRLITAPDGSHHLICQGEQRFTVLDFVSKEPFLVARIDAHREPTTFDQDIEARGLKLREKALEAVQLLPQAPGELTNAIRSVESIAALSDMIVSFMDLKLADKQDILASFDLQTRLDRVLALLNRRVEVLKVSRQIDEKARDAFDERQKEAVLRERLHQIQKELGESDGSKSELEELQQSVNDAGMPEEVLEQAKRELNRLQRMPEQAAEYSMARTYLEWLLAMPWSKLDPEQVDIEAARKILDEDHFGLAKVKRRILEFLAVRKLNPEGRSPILCFVGPPGVGKTSLGQSIAKAIGLKFGRISLGGVHDEAEIRGHRRTYIGSLPGNIAQALRKTGRRNPVLILDEVDKLSASHQGDPFAALLEVLDPEQNHSFRDNYLGVPFDLSKVLFIATANVLDAIPGPLRDRMEIIELTGYTEEEKLQIARRYLLKRQLKANGLTAEQVPVSDGALRRLITDYTREAGVRGLERQIGALLRHSAVTIASGDTRHRPLDADDVAKILGAARYESDVALRTSIPGVATGLAWTPAGGDILFIESSRVRGSGKLILTGQLGDVMKESAQAAVTLVKSLADRLGLDPALLDHSDLHIHVPAGAIPKDGPSAGVAISTSLASLLTQRTVRSDVAMTGEISLRGVVMPVGGIRRRSWLRRGPGFAP